MCDVLQKKNTIVYIVTLYLAMLKIAYYLTLVCSSKVLSRGTSSRYIKFDLRIIIIGVSPLLNVTSYNVLIVLRLLYSCHSVSLY